MGKTVGFGVRLLLVVCAATAVGCGTASSGDRSPGSAGASRRTTGYEVRAASSAPANDDGDPLGMRAEQGSIDRDDAEEAINRHFTKLSRCYDQAGEARDFAGGSVTLRFLIATDGRPTEVNVIESRLGSLEVERCLRSTALRIRFPRPHGHAAATFEYSLEFRSTGEIPVVDLPGDAAARALHALLARVNAGCRELGVEELAATLYIDRQGRVRSVGFASDKPIPEVSEGCVAKEIRGSRIPVDVQGSAVARTLIALRNQDVLHPPVLAKRPERATRQGRRVRSGRR